MKKGDSSAESSLKLWPSLSVSTRVVVEDDLLYTPPRAQCTSPLLGPSLGGGEAVGLQWQVVVVLPQLEGVELGSPTRAL